MITVVYNPVALIASASTVRQPSEFPQAVRQSLDALDKEGNLILYVAQPAVFEWLKNMALRYPHGTFVFETVDARRALADRWGIGIPETVTNDDILDAGLLDLESQPGPGETFEDFLLAQFFAPPFSAKTFPFSKLASLVSAVDPQRWRANLAIPLLARLLHARFDKWKATAQSADQRELIGLFESDPAALRANLMRFRVLHNYPEAGRAILGDLFSLLAALKLPLQDLAIDQNAIPDAISQVNYYLSAQRPQSADDLAALLPAMSGVLSAEFDWLEKYLRQNPNWATREIIAQIDEKFGGQASRLTRRITALRRLIRPAKPEIPDASWDVSAMLRWATDSYLPYQAWCDANDQFDPQLYEIGDAFSQWLLNHWDDVHANSGSMVFNILPNITPELKRDGTVNVVLVVDNLAWSFSQMLDELFEQHGYYLSGSQPYVAMLPTETEISKKCLLSGEVGYTHIDDKTYKGITEKGWVPYFGEDHSLRYLSDIGNLRKVDKIDAKTYVVNYLAVDKALHQSASEIGMPHREHVGHLLAKLVQDVVEFVEEHELQDKVRIHVVSDHGSTRIPATLGNHLDPEFFKTNGFGNPSHRYVTVAPDRFARLPDYLKLDCYFLPANEFLNPENVLCARAGNRFLPVGEDVYLHGGLLPEEVIVPYRLYDPATSELRDPTVLLKKNEFYYGLQTVELEIGNPNGTAIEGIEVQLLNGNVESDPARIDALRGKTSIVVQLKARFSQKGIPEEQSSLQIRVRFLARGQKHSCEVSREITMKRVAEEKKTHLFDD
jgi:hypothetical protein